MEDRIVQGQPPTESLPVPLNDPISQEITQEMPTDAIPGTLLSDKLTNLGHDIPQMRLLPQPLSTVVEGASSAPLEVGDFVATWKPLFDNIKIFGDLMGSLAEVCTNLAGHNEMMLTCYVRYIRTRRWLGAFYPYL